MYCSYFISICRIYQAFIHEFSTASKSLVTLFAHFPLRIRIRQITHLMGSSSFIHPKTITAGRCSQSPMISPNGTEMHHRVTSYANNANFVSPPPRRMPITQVADAEIKNTITPETTISCETSSLVLSGRL